MTRQEAHTRACDRYQRALFVIRNLKPTATEADVVRFAHELAGADREQNRTRLALTQTPRHITEADRQDTRDSPF